MYRTGKTSGLTQAHPVLFRMFSNHGTKRTRLWGRQTVNVAVQPARFAREYSTHKLLPVQNIYRSASASFSAKVPRLLVNDEEFHEIMATFPEIVRDICQDADVAGHPEVADRISKMSEYNVPGGKKTSLFLLLAAFKAFAAPGEITQQNLRNAHILAWCSQLGFTSLMMTDDMMDDSEMRRGKLCWFRQKEVGMIGINDAMMIEYGGVLLLRRHFRQHPRYVSFVEEYQNLMINTAKGQIMDLQCTRDGKPQLDLFTKARHNVIGELKSSFTIYLPIAFATLLAGVDAETTTKSKNLMMEIGHWFQVQDDFLDYKGTTAVIGKDVANDIKDGKCSWMAVTALERASPEQRGIMERCYGSADPKDIQAIRDLYKQLNIEQVYAVQEEKFYEGLRAQINRDFSGQPQEMFHQLIDTLHNRKL